MKKIKGFTLIELLIVVAIIGIIAAIAIPNLLDAIERSRQKKSVGEVKSISNALQSFTVDYGGYPPTTAIGNGNIGQALDQATYTDADGDPAFEPDYMQAIPVLDGWSIAYRWQVGPDGDIVQPRLGTVTSYHFVVGSLGSNHAEGGGNTYGGLPFTTIAQNWCADPQQLGEANTGTLQSFCYETDIVWGDSSFLQAPEGKQKHCD